MKKIFAAAVTTTLIAAASVAASTAPASAFGIYVGPSYGYGYGYGYGGPTWYYGYQPTPVVVAPTPYYGGGEYAGGDSWEAHQDWCDQRFQTYDRSTDLYFYAPGKQRHCDSPFN